MNKISFQQASTFNLKPDTTHMPVYCYSYFPDGSISVMHADHSMCIIGQLLIHSGLLLCVLVFEFCVFVFDFLERPVFDPCI